MREKQVQIPLSLYQNLVRYFLMREEDAEQAIIEALREKQDANMRRVAFSAKLKAEKALKKQ